MNIQKKNILLKKILILGGGFSKEREVSLDTAKSVYRSIKKKYKVFSLSKNNPKSLRYIKNVKYFYGDISKYHSIKFN